MLTRVINPSTRKRKKKKKIRYAILHLPGLIWKRLDSALAHSSIREVQLAMVCNARRATGTNKTTDAGYREQRSPVHCTFFNFFLFLTAALLRSYDLRIVGMTVPSSA